VNWQVLEALIASPGMAGLGIVGLIGVFLSAQCKDSIVGSTDVLHEPPGVHMLSGSSCIERCALHVQLS